MHSRAVASGFVDLIMQTLRCEQSLPTLASFEQVWMQSMTTELHTDTIQVGTDAGNRLIITERPGEGGLPSTGMQVAHDQPYECPATTRRIIACTSLNAAVALSIGNQSSRAPTAFLDHCLHELLEARVYIT